MAANTAMATRQILSTLLSQGDTGLSPPQQPDAVGAEFPENIGVEEIVMMLPFD